MKLMNGTRSKSCSKAPTSIVIFSWEYHDHVMGMRWKCHDDGHVIEMDMDLGKWYIPIHYAELVGHKRGWFTLLAIIYGEVVMRSLDFTQTTCSPISWFCSQVTSESASRCANWSLEIQAHAKWPIWPVNSENYDLVGGFNPSEKY